ncbi:MAG: hypothetical protein JZU64_03500 [Rhodoferax sp.]|nr:hypothetical protein [Rhodoferax sp.]
MTFNACFRSLKYAYVLARNSFEASFLDDTLKRQHIDRLTATFETFV